MKAELFCDHCNERILEGDALANIINSTMHWECGLRLIIGGANHLLKRCSCCGGTEPPDPENMTAREAAIFAVSIWQARRDGAACW